MNINRNLYYNFILRLSLNLLFILTAAFYFNYSTVQADTADTPTAWINFDPFFEITLNGVPLRDFETSSDPTRGSGAVTPDRSDIASGYDGTNGAESNCNPAIPTFDRCGLETSAFWAYYDGGTTWDNVDNSASMNDDYLAFRMRINGDPNTNGIGLNSTHWNFLIDTDGDGFKEFWVDMDGSATGGPNSADELLIRYNNADTQACDPSCDQVEIFTACSATSANCLTSHTQGFPVTNIDPTDTT